MYVTSVASRNVRSAGGVPCTGTVKQPKVNDRARDRRLWPFWRGASDSKSSCAWHGYAALPAE